MIILDTSAVTALATGHKALNLLAGNMARTPSSGDQLRLPALCLMQAEADEAHLHRRVLAFSSVAVDPLDTISAATVGAMIRDGYGGPDTCHALYCALPRAEFTGLSILLTEHEDRYPPGVVTVDINAPGMLGFH
ncbi:hypothetical protein [Streptomyces sp. NBC_01361]|uniref:hypothetical protein n=1 Tax=Streptomyces sp. NBC_01361 TaxID=2903838 RepID=UPI002E37AAE4|nr:hypothetical protein [Streptomyces sp. NBC_01361]